MGLLGFVPLVSWGSSTPSTRQVLLIPAASSPDRDGSDQLGL
jgi:hypothetical protein